MKAVTLTLSEGDVELLEQLLSLTSDLCEELPTIEDSADLLADYEGGTGNKEHSDTLDFLEELHKALTPLRAKDTRLARLRDKLQAAQIQERRIA